MNPNKAWERTFNAAITGLTSNPQNPQLAADNVVGKAKAIADLAVQYHIQFAGTVNQSMQSDLAPQLKAQEKIAYKSDR